MHNWTYFICPICAEPLSYLGFGSIGYINSQYGRIHELTLCEEYLGRVIRTQIFLHSSEFATSFFYY